jgi:hypothetical protein
MSAIASAKTQAGGNGSKPGKPTGLTVTLTSTTAQASWNAVTGAMGYILSVSADPDDEDSAALELCEGTTYSETFSSAEVPAGMTLYFCVFAFNENGLSEASDVVIKTVPGTGISTSPDIATGTPASRRYRVEVYNTDSATNAHLSAAYGSKEYEEAVKDYVTSKGHIAANSYNDQTFDDVITKWKSAASGIGYDSAEGVGWLTEALKTYPRGGLCIWYYVGSTYRFFYVHEPEWGSGKFTVETYNINSAAYDYLDKTYGGKTYWDVIKADVISMGNTAANTYTAQTYDDVISKWDGLAAGFTITVVDNGVTYSLKDWGDRYLENALKTQNRSGYGGLWFNQGASYRYFFVGQE